MELQEAKLTLNVYLDENQRLIQELGEYKFKMLSMGNDETPQIQNDEDLLLENEELKKKIEDLQSQLMEVKENEQKLKEKQEEAKRNKFGSFGSIGSNHRDSTGYMTIKNPSSDNKINSIHFVFYKFLFQFLWKFLLVTFR
jgi:hypothetical protein